MKGTVTKKHFFLIAKEFGWKVALRILISNQKAALNILMEAA